MWYLAKIVQRRFYVAVSLQNLHHHRIASQSRAHSARIHARIGDSQSHFVHARAKYCRATGTGHVEIAIALGGPGTGQAREEPMFRPVVSVLGQDGQVMAGDGP